MQQLGKLGGRGPFEKVEFIKSAGLGSFSAGWLKTGVLRMGAPA